MIKKQPVNAKGQTEEEFLKAYDAGRYPCPALSVDMLIFSKYENRLKLLLQWALPGGFLNIGEDILDAAYRELKEETSIERNQVQLYQLHTYGAVHRDPRMRVVSVAHVALINQDVKVEAKDDADDAAWFEVQINDNTLTLYHAQHRMQYHMKTARSVNPDQEALAFDHIQMILDALHSLTLLPII